MIAIIIIGYKYSENSVMQTHVNPNFRKFELTYITKKGHLQKLQF
jgi:hypothetical protein